MEDYEFYSVDPGFYYIEEERLLRVIQAEEAIAKFFRPTHKAKIPGLLFPLDAFTFGDAVFTRCRTVADLEATLLKR